MIRSNGTDRPARGRALAFSLLVLTAAFSLAASLVASPAQTQRGEAKPIQIRLGVKQGDKQTDLKFVSERGELTKATATDSAGTRSLKRIDKLAMPCKEADMVCRTVETEGGIIVGVCYCPDTQTALLLPAVQSAREAARSKNTNTNTNTNTNSGGSGGGGITKIGPGTLTLGGANAAGAPHVKVFSGATGAELTRRCWGDEKLQLFVCPQ